MAAMSQDGSVGISRFCGGVQAGPSTEAVATGGRNEGGREERTVVAATQQRPGHPI